ncbi:MAG TPA: methyltransferase domain-containing protein [Acidimicrobiales bacterium]|nr:methyltransferase domain-containing protein [Acidimicrobiales bacterium]
MTTSSLDAAAAWSAVADAWEGEDRAAPTAEAFTRLVDALDVRPGDRVLELAAGPGGLGARWSELVGRDGEAIVSDFAPGMVEVARRHTAGLPNVSVACIDAAAIDFPDASFDAVGCCMGLMFTPEPAVALAEIHRVLRAGGRFAALTWGGLADNPWMAIVGMAAMLNGIVAGAPPTEPGGIFSLSDPELVARLTREAGFTDVDVTAVDVPFAAESAEAHIANVSALAGPLAVALQAAPPDTYAAFLRSALELAAPYESPEGFRVNGTALLVSGRR